MIVDQNALRLIQKTIYEICRINISDTKQTMVQNRVNSMLKDPQLSHINTIDSLISTVKTNTYAKQSFINNFTTNKTDLFRESYHFDDMINRVLPPLVSRNANIKIFCSASSTGEEPYSIAATCEYAKKIHNSSSNIKIVATDINTEVLDKAKRGEYLFDEKLNKIPNWVKLEDYFDIKKLDEKNYRIFGTTELKAKSYLKNMINFEILNLFSNSYPFSSFEFDIIFCRNVLIYFKTSDQMEVLSKLHSHLKVGGTLYLGHSEDALGLNKTVNRLGNKIFVKMET